jgi:hypothetical protein
MADQTPEELLAEAQAFEADAVRAGEESAAGHALRAQAADVRVRVLGTRVYPVLICATCHHVTGWTSAAGVCDLCLRSAKLNSAFSDPHGGWVAVNDTRTASAKRSALPLRARLSALTARGAAVDHAWLARVDPDETGPAAPEHGYELEVAMRDEVVAADDSGLVVRFATRTNRFEHAAWVRLETTRIARGALLVPAEFSAGLPIEQLAEAWGDYRAAVDAFNARAWATASQARDDEHAALQARDEAVRDQRDVADLLDEQ